MSVTRVYTPFDEIVDEALSRAPRTGLVSDDSSQAQKLHALVTFANNVLREDEEREEKIAAYRELAADTERSAAIREANLAAATRGVL
ncbi:MAG TPA: hypothetical protein VNC40_07130 [Gaiellaceae bacterium]|nr:hypothetical protein [Gaiellaceae bacterium]